MVFLRHEKRPDSALASLGCACGIYKAAGRAMTIRVASRLVILASLLSVYAVAQGTQTKAGETLPSVTNGAAAQGTKTAPAEAGFSFVVNGDSRSMMYLPYRSD